MSDESRSERSRLGVLLSPHTVRPAGYADSEVIIMQNEPKKQRPTKGRPRRAEKPISDVYPVIDNDLARDNVENDLPAADREALR